MPCATSLSSPRKKDTFRSFGWQAHARIDADPAGQIADVEATADRLDAVPHSLKTDPPRPACRFARDPDAVVRDNEFEKLADMPHHDRNGRRMGVAIDVDERFLRDPQQRSS